MGEEQSGVHELEQSLIRQRLSRLAECHKREDASIELLVGPLACGKSTYARERVKKGRTVIVCHDDLVAMLHGEHDYESKLRKTYHRMEEDIVRAALKSTHPHVIIDRTNLTRANRERWIEFGMENNVPVIATVFPVETVEIHARRRFEADPRGQSYLTWANAAEHQCWHAKSEPIRLDEGFKFIRRYDRVRGVLIYDKDATAP